MLEFMEALLSTMPLERRGERGEGLNLMNGIVAISVVISVI